MGLKFYVTFSGDIGRSGRVMLLTLFVAGLEWLLSNEKKLISSEKCCNNWRDVVPILFQPPIMVTENLCRYWCE